MRERINRLAKGIIDMEVPQLLIQPERIEEEVQAGENVRREVFVTSGNGLHSKGLVYSSNSRVQVRNSSFGGLRNHIGYEIDTHDLEQGDVIEGSFYLVTNGGEKEVPYVFRIQLGMSGQLLEQMKTPQDLAKLAKEDYETALRIFEYRDFTEVPFMQDLHIRAIYDGIKGHGNRSGQLEQFLIALGVKEVVHLSVQDPERTYRGLKDPEDGELIIRRSGWGYLPIQVHVDGDFIQVLKTSLDEKDFQEDQCQFLYRLDPEGLHGGRNFGRIVLETCEESLEITFDVSAAVPETVFGEHRRRHFWNYALLRLEHERRQGDLELLRNQMCEELQALQKQSGEVPRLLLMEAELRLLMGQNEKVEELLEACKDTVLRERLNEPEDYCYYQYLWLQLYPSAEKKASLGRLLRKYMQEARLSYLLFYLYTRCEEQYCYENPGEMLIWMRQLYEAGCRSPFLYQQALDIWNDAPQLFDEAGAFELQVLYFGARRKLIREKLLQRMLRFGGRQKLWMKMWKLLYEQYPQREVLEVVCGLMIRRDCRGNADFVWYERAVKEQLSLTRLYEYFLYSLPSDYEQLIPKEVLLYFSYGNELDRRSRSVLYANIIRYLRADSPIYREYQKEMGRFAAEQVLQSRIDSRLAVIYDAIICEGMIDSSIARVLPSILKSYRIRVKNPRMRQVVVCYEELLEEGIYPINDGIAYVPIFSSKCCILFQDDYGNRYADISHVKVPVMDKPELEKVCFEVYPEHPMLLLSACRGALAEETLDAEGMELLIRALESLKLHPLYQGIMSARILAYYQNEEPSDGLAVIDETLLSREQKNAFCEGLIINHVFQKAYELLTEYQCEIRAELLAQLCSYRILNQLFDQNASLLQLSYQVFEKKLADHVILDYLCEYFNGTSEQMYQLLVTAVEEQVETYDLEERLLAQMLFSGETGKMDRVFSLYMKRKTPGSLLVKAYFAVKSADYFLYGVPAGEEVFRYLEGMVFGTSDKDKVSTIYLLALTKYYAGLERLDEKQKEFCQSLVDVLLRNGMVLAHFQKLAAHISIPEEVMDKGIIQYIGHKDSKVELQIRIRPQEETFSRDEMTRLYQGIFVRQKVLFEGESLDYRILELEGENWVLKDEGTVTCERRSGETGEGRFRLLNEMVGCLQRKDETKLRNTMEEYVKKTEVIEGLFSLL